eukprot:COSAG02_NODE_7095_length_3188_cov_13.479922_1_plen_174_part_00
MTAIIGKCFQPYAPSKDPNIDTLSMAYIWECDGPRGLKATMFKDPNCVTKGSWYDFYTGVSGGPGVNFSASLGDVLAISMDKPTMLASSGAIRFGEQLNMLHGCKSPPSPPAPPPAPPPPKPDRRSHDLPAPTNTLYIIAIVAAAVVGLGVGMLVGARRSSGVPKDTSSIQIC